MTEHYPPPPGSPPPPPARAAAPIPDSSRLAKQITCVKREIGKRQGVYPKWVAQGRLKAEDAEREIAEMSAVLCTLQWLKSLLELPEQIETKPLK